MTVGSIPRAPTFSLVRSGWRVVGHIAPLAGLTLALAACGRDGRPPPSTDHAAAADRLLHAASEPQSWLTHGGTYSEQRYSTLDAVNAANVGKLSLTWSYDFDTNRGQEATPLVVDGVMYVTSAWSKVYALDAATGKPLWAFDPKVPGATGVKGCCDVVNRGVAYFDGKIYFGAFDGRLIALDAKTGTVVWSVQTTDPAGNYTITGAPRIAKGKVFIGNGGAEMGVRGYLTAYDAETGRKVWRFYTVPADPAKGPDHEVSDRALSQRAAGTWFGRGWIDSGGGGTVWDSIVYDPELDLLYFGVGNGSPWDFGKRSDGKGDNLFLSSIVAVKPETGEYVWHYQETPSESWDFTATAQIVLASLTIDGRKRRVLMHAPKNGFFYVIDRQSGKLLSARNYVPTNWATHVDMATGRPVETDIARFTTGTPTIQPAVLGGHDWQPMSFDPTTGLVYIPAHVVPLPFGKDPGFKRRPMGYNVAVNTLGWTPPDDLTARRKFLARYRGYLLAWDPVRQKEVWRVEQSGPWNGGTLSTGGGLVFAGNRDGQFQAYRASDGARLWSFQGTRPIMAGPITYAIKGEQYVAVLAGYGGAFGIVTGGVPNPRPMPNGGVLVFKLGGTATAPVDSSRQVPAVVVDEAFTPERVAKGSLIFAQTCAVCHGLSAQSSGVIPDLRRSSAIADERAFEQVVLHGALQDRGMANFSPILTQGDVAAVRAYVASKSRIAAEQEGTLRK